MTTRRMAKDHVQISRIHVFLNDRDRFLNGNRMAEHLSIDISASVNIDA
jgi:hypothetical protein